MTGFLNVGLGIKEIGCLGRFKIFNNSSPRIFFSCLATYVVDSAEEVLEVKHIEVDGPEIKAQVLSRPEVKRQSGC